ncbi:MAG: AraC family transcriptional regulator [Pseudomonadota bacterium]
MTQQTASSLAEFYRDPESPYARFPQEQRVGGRLPIKMIRAEQEAFEAVDPAVPEINLIVGLKAETQFSWDVGDGWTDERRWRSGDINLAPTQTAVSYRCRGDHEILVLGFSHEAVIDILDNHRAGTLASFDPLTSGTLFRDETLRRTAMQLWTESARTGGTSDLLIDGLTQVLIARLLDKAGALRRTQIIVPLTQIEIAKLDDVITHRMAERLTVADLARVLDMPRWTFADAFKAATGDTPHAFVTAKRVDKACELLRTGDMALAEIAYATGFASQSHMTDTFRRTLGTTPGKWRREVRS